MRQMMEELAQNQGVEAAIRAQIAAQERRQQQGAQERANIKAQNNKTLTSMGSRFKALRQACHRQQDWQRGIFQEDMGGQVSVYGTTMGISVRRTGVDMRITVPSVTKIIRQHNAVQ